LSVFRNVYNIQSKLQMKIHFTLLES
jgi:hypothetical protein